MCFQCVVKVTDFGLAKWSQFSKTHTSSHGLRGTLTHIPPEIWRDLNCPRTVKFDIYGYGILLWELVTEETAFSDGKYDARCFTLFHQFKLIQK